MSFIRERAAGGAVSVETVARAAGCSRRYLEMRFRSRLGRTVHEEVVRERIEHVKRLLETSAAPIADIAAAVGFPAEAHLFALFRKTAGMTMRDWRRTHRDGPHPR